MGPVSGLRACRLLARAPGAGSPPADTRNSIPPVNHFFVKFVAFDCRAVESSWQTGARPAIAKIAPHSVDEENTTGRASLRSLGMRVTSLGARPTAAWASRASETTALTTLAAAFPRFGSRGDRASVGPELGVEPPIRLGDDRLDRNERRGTSVRWLAGATLTGLCGLTLIGAALYLDLDSQYDFAEAPEFATPARPAGNRRKRASIPPRAIGFCGRSTSSRTNRPLRSQRSSRSGTRKLSRRDPSRISKPR